MAEKQDDAEGRPASTSETTGANAQQERDPVLSAFAELVGDLALDLARGTLGPAVAGMHDEWRAEAAELRRDTAEWIARVNASRQHMEQVVARQHELAQEVYNTHAKLLQEMAAFQKERQDAQKWQEHVTAGLDRLGELQRELSVETTRIAGVVRDIIGELARYQTDMEKRFGRFEETLEAALRQQFEAVQERLQAAAQRSEEAMEALSKTNEETRSVLGRDLTALRREVQEVATRIGRDVTENRAVMQQNTDQRLSRFEQQMQSTSRLVLGVLVAGEVVLLIGVAYLIMLMFQ